MTKFFFCLAAALTLAGCTTGDGSGLVASAPGTVDVFPTGTVGHDRRDIVLPPQSAALTLPGFQAARVRERTYDDGVLQQIEFAGPTPHGSNLLEVMVRTAPDASAGAAVPLAKPTEAGIRAEIMSRFPDIRMQIVPKPSANRFGPFGLAIGRHADATRCLFAWQWIDGLGADAMPASVRLRLCRSGMTVDDLARAMQGLTLGDKQAMDHLRAPRVIASPTAAVPALAPAGTNGTLEQALGAPAFRAAPQLRPTTAAPKRSSQAKRAPEPATPLEPFSGPYLAPVKQSRVSAQPGHRTSVARSTSQPVREPRRPDIAAALPAQ